MANIEPVCVPLVREPLFRSSSRVNADAPEKDRVCYGIEVVARDGLEPPTPAFSGLRSTN